MTDRVHVLHVDDDPDFLDLSAAMLGREDERFTITTGAGAEAGLETVSEVDVDVVVSDYDMAGMDGLAFLRAVRDRDPDLPFILFTGKGSEEVASEAISAGVTDYLQKRPGPDQYALLANRILNAVEQHRARMDLQHQERFLYALLEQSNERISVVDEDGVYRYMSPSSDRIMGWSEDELLGKDAFEFVHPDDRDELRPVFEEAVANPEQTFSAEYRVRRKDGDWEWVESYGNNRLDDPAVEGFIVNSWTITERKERELELARCETIIENIPDAVWMIDHEGALTFVNRHVEEQLDRPREEILGCSYEEVLVADVGLAEEAIEAFSRDVDAVLSGARDAVRTTVGFTRGGDKVVRHVQIAPVLVEGAVTGAVGINRDVTGLL